MSSSDFFSPSESILKHKDTHTDSTPNHYITSSFQQGVRMVKAYSNILKEAFSLAYDTTMASISLRKESHDPYFASASLSTAK